ncbi:MAG: MFS transporter, partial [Acidobacteriaceae bacterium]
VFAGPVLDLHGAKKMMIAALLLIAASLAVLPALRIYWQLQICCLAYGLGGGILNTSTNVLIADLNTESRASALNLLGFFFSGGAILAPFLTSAAGGGLASTTVLRILAGVTASILIPVLVFPFPAPPRAGIRLRSLFSVLNQPLVWLFGAILIFESGSENCVFVWTGKIATEVLHTTPARGGLALVALAAALGIGRLLAIVWLRLLGNAGTIWLSSALILVGITIALTARSLTGMIFATAVIGLGIAGIYPTVLGIAGNHFSGETGTVFGAIIALGLLGGAAGPTIGGFAARYGMLHVLWIPAVSAVAVGLLIAVVNTRSLPDIR